MEDIASGKYIIEDFALRKFIIEYNSLGKYYHKHTGMREPISVDYFHDFFQ
mgnify:CR=1 FL=1